MAQHQADPKLTPRQRRAMLALASGCTEAEAAELIGAGRRTVARWKAQPHFQAELRQATDELRQRAMRQLAAETGAAVTFLSAVVSGEQDASTAQRVRAAEIILRSTITYHEHAELAERVAVLESELIR